ncbi:hypothetical protein [Devosia sp.]|uniref:hypothetical protein n=1 Tax=Devosia sp. TaxID=1871048 RepID=UPI001B2268FA|nr:hypothetical protein [Devosia sp.]MBO9589523.1 hypothetical protein [Devosia sp.]
MAVLTPASVYAPGRKPPKAEIIQLLEQIMGSSNAPAVVKQTKAALDAVTPASENYGGRVLNDPDPTKNGDYFRSGGIWVWGRGFPDTFASVTLAGPADAQTGDAASGVNPATVLLFFAAVSTENTGPMTLSIAGETPRAVLNAAGNPLAAGEWKGSVVFFINDDGDYQLLFDAGAAASAAQSASDAADALAAMLELYLGPYPDDTAASAAAGTPVVGQMYFNTTDGKFRVWNGTIWQDQSTGLSDGEVTEPKIATTLANQMAPNVATRSALKALDTSRYQFAYLGEIGRQGMFQWHSSDVSAQVARRSVASTSVDAGTDVITSAGHRLKTGDAIVPTSAIDGLSANTFYYAIRASSSTFKVASSRANALAGTAFNLTAASAVTFNVVPDDLEGEVIVKSGAAKNGSAGAWLRCKAVQGEYLAQHFGLVVGNSSDNSEPIAVAMHVAEEAGGGLVRLPAGSIYMTRTIIARRLVFLEGAGKQATRLKWYTTAPLYGIDALDAWTDGAYPYDRTICGFSRFTIDGLNTTSPSDFVGVRLGNNHRSSPILSQMVVAFCPNHGILFDADNWNIDIIDVEIDSCAKYRSNAAGIFKNPAVTDLNHVNFTRVRVEGCGNGTSAAGGINASTTTLSTNRGWQFTDCQAEGNLGSSEVLFSNMRGMYFTGWYMEVINVGSHTVGMEFNNCTGLISGAQIIAEAGSPVTAIKVSNNSSRLVVMAVDFGSEWDWLIDSYNASVIRYAQLVGSASNRNNDTSTITAM